MKKIILFVGALMITGASFAHDGDKTGKKACCKDGEKKEACASKDHGKDGGCAKASGKKACCKKDGNADQKKTS